MKLTDNEKLDIAEFIFADETDTLIRSEAEKIAELFRSKELEVPELNAGAIRRAINKNIPQDEREQIMEDYYAGSL